MGVRSIAQIKRDGFWVIGKANYINDYVEFSSWGVRMGYPFTWIYNVTEAKMLLYLLNRLRQMQQQLLLNRAHTPVIELHQVGDHDEPRSIP